MRRNNKRNEDEDLDKLDWDLEAGSDMDFEDEFLYGDEEEQGDMEDRYFGEDKNNNKKFR